MQDKTHRHVPPLLQRRARDQSRHRSPAALEQEGGDKVRRQSRLGLESLPARTSASSRRSVSKVNDLGELRRPLRAPGHHSDVILGPGKQALDVREHLLALQTCPHARLEINLSPPLFSSSSS